MKKFTANYELGCFVSTAKFGAQYKNQIELIGTFAIEDDKVYVPFSMRELAAEFFEKIGAEAEFENIDEKYQFPCVTLDPERMQIRVVTGTHGIDSIVHSYIHCDNHYGFFTMGFRANYMDTLNAIKTEFGGISIEEDFDEKVVVCLEKMKSDETMDYNDRQKIQLALRSMILKMYHKENIELNDVGIEYIRKLESETPEKYWRD